MGSNKSKVKDLEPISLNEKDYVFLMGQTGKIISILFITKYLISIGCANFKCIVCINT